MATRMSGYVIVLATGLTGQATVARGRSDTRGERMM
jgi:hypothetical protein